MPFAQGAAAWVRELGNVRNAVRQELVARQLAAHLGDGRPLRVLDAGCGQGTQAVALARLGHDVVGVDLSEDLLARARRMAADEPGDVRGRLRFARADILDLGRSFPDRFDVACCHGVAMYLPSLQETVNALLATVRPGGLMSLLTRNRAGIAMRAGMSGDWPGAVTTFDASHYTNRLGIHDVRADDPADVRRAVTEAGATTVAWYGVRLFSDHWESAAPSADFAQLLEAEEAAGRRDPYRSLAALTHTLAESGPAAELDES